MKCHLRDILFSSIKNIRIVSQFLQGYSQNKTSLFKLCRSYKQIGALSITEMHMIIFQVEIRRCEICMREMEVEGTVITIPHISIRYISENED